MSLLHYDPQSQASRVIFCINIYNLALNVAFVSPCMSPIRTSAVHKLISNITKSTNEFCNVIIELNFAPDINNIGNWAMAFLREDNFLRLIISDLNTLLDRHYK